MMNEYIEREKLIKEFEFQLEEHGNPDLDRQPVAYGSKLGTMYGLSIAQTIPAADVETVIHGKWISQKACGDFLWYCSECRTVGDPEWKRCPVCEAKMDEESEGNGDE